MRVPERRFLQGALLLPLVLPLLLAPLYNSTASSIAAQLSAILFASLVYGGLPYLVFAAGLLWWGRRKRVTDWVWMATIVPLIFAALATIVVGATMAYTAGPGGRAEAALLFGALSCAYALVLGYGYVCVVMLGRSLLGRLGVLERERVALE